MPPVPSPPPSAPPAPPPSPSAPPIFVQILVFTYIPRTIMLVGLLLFLTWFCLNPRHACAVLSGAINFSHFFDRPSHIRGSNFSYAWSRLVSGLPGGAFSDLSPTLAKKERQLDQSFVAASQGGSGGGNGILNGLIRVPSISGLSSLVGVESHSGGVAANVAKFTRIEADAEEEMAIWERAGLGSSRTATGGAGECHSSRAVGSPMRPMPSGSPHIIRSPIQSPSRTPAIAAHIAWERRKKESMANTRGEVDLFAAPHESEHDGLGAAELLMAGLHDDDGRSATDAQDRKDDRARVAVRVAAGAEALGPEARPLSNCGWASPLSRRGATSGRFTLGGTDRTPRSPAGRSARSDSQRFSRYSPTGKGVPVIANPTAYMV